ncbi:hypothetical protein [[Kitasatospora] papulosa]|uniref:hypothetical protein n=1 Tax=[Kitasatospora] papulosa TaxID=1464011 RepID=UPI0036A287F3
MSFLDRVLANDRVRASSMRQAAKESGGTYESASQKATRLRQQRHKTAVSQKGDGAGIKPSRRRFDWT